MNSPLPLVECVEVVMDSKDRTLLEEFNQESETVFSTDDSCYEHYKEMQREGNTTFILRSDKQFFQKQAVLAKEGVFEKQVPTWASDLNLLARVVWLQYQMVRTGAENNKINVAGRPHPGSFSWCFWDDCQQRASSTLPSQSELGSKQQRLQRECKEMMEVLEKLTVEGKTRKLQQQSGK